MLGPHRELFNLVGVLCLQRPQHKPHVVIRTLVMESGKSERSPSIALEGIQSWYSHESSVYNEGRNVLFNNALNTYYLWLYDVGHVVMDHSDSERESPLPPLHGLHFPIMYMMKDRERRKTNVLA